MAKAPASIRAWGAPQLVAHFAKIIQGAHVMKRRDDNLISEFMMRNAYDPIDVLYLMNEYRGRTPLDIRGFIRWVIRNDPLDDVSYAYREVVVAELMGINQAPLEVWIYFDYEGKCNSAADVANLVTFEAYLRTFVDSVLGERVS